jgi:hypothetical protein
MDSGGADVGREFSSGFGDGERRKMDVCEDFEGIVELDEVDNEVLRAGFNFKKKVNEGGQSGGGGYYLEMGSSTES